MAKSKIRTFVFLLLYIFILSGILFITGCIEPGGCVSSNPLKSGSHYFTIDYDGLKRNYWVYIPVSYNNEPVPVVFDLHPVLTSASIQQLLSGMRQKAEDENFIVVQPNGSSVVFGLSGSWNGGPSCCPPANNKDNPIDDVGFILKIIEDLKNNRVCVDENRVYADGMSNGGYLSHRLACEASDVFAAIGPVAASIGYDNINECQPDRPVPVFMFSGGEDHLERKTKTADYWAYEVNGCDEVPPVERLRKGDVVCYRYQNCSGAPVEHCIGEGVGHCWPSPYVNILPCTTDINVTDLIWEFFEQNPM